MKRQARARPHHLLLLLILSFTSTALADGERSRVVFHVNSGQPEAQHGALRNLDNHIAAVGAERLDIKVILQGGGVTMLLLPEALSRLSGITHANAGPDFKRRIDTLRGLGVSFRVSGQYLRKHGIDFRHDLYGLEESDVVDNALSELSRLQNLGYAYIKP